MIARRPSADEAVPQPLRDLAAGAPITPLWRNELGGVTVRIDGDEPLVAKWSAAPAPPLDAEADRMRWLRSVHPVPEVLACRETDEGWLLVTRALQGSSAVDDRWLADPAVAVEAIATGLARLHRLDPAACPFDWRPATRIAAARALGMHVPARLERAPSVDTLVIAHGDACAPNTMVDDDGGFLATVDLGSLGVADRWADLAVATMSLEWNYGPGWEPVFWRAYGIEPDEHRVVYYRALWDAT